MSQIETLLHQVCIRCRGAYLLNRVARRIRIASGNTLTLAEIEADLIEHCEVIPGPSGQVLLGWALR